MNVLKTKNGNTIIFELKKERLNGKTVVLNEKNSIISRCEYLNGRRHGLQIFFDKKGESCRFNNAKRDKFHGISLYFYENRFDLVKNLQKLVQIQ